MRGTSTARGSRGLALPSLLGLAGLLALLAALSALSAPASAAGSGSWPPPASGDWWVTSPTAVDNETVQVNGSLFVYFTGLTLDNVTLLFNSTAGLTYGLQVYWGSSALNVTNSNVTVWNASYRFYWYNYGALHVERSEVSRLADYGIYTYSGNLVVRDNSIHGGSYGGISAYYGNSQPALVLENNTIFDINYYAVVLQVYSYYGAGAGPHDLGADFVMRNNTVRDNTGGGIYVYRYFYDYLNTASSMRSNLTIENNSFLRNRGHALYVYNSVWNGQGAAAADVSVTGRLNITGNTIEDNAAYEAVFLVNAITATFSGSCTVDLALNFSNNQVINNSGAGVFIDYANGADHSTAADVLNAGSIIVADNTIARNQGYGLYIYRYAAATNARNASVNGTISILRNTINNNADAGIYAWNYAFSTSAYSALIDGPVRIENNTVVYNSGYGIYTYNYAQKYQGDQNGTAEIRGDLTVKGNEVAFNLGYNSVQVTRTAASYTGSSAYIGGDIDVSNNRVYNNSGNGVDIAFSAYKNLGKTSGLSLIESNLTLEGNWVANNSLYTGVSIDRVATTYYSSASKVVGWTRIRSNIIEGHDSNGLLLQQRTLNYYGSSGAESSQKGDVTIENNTVRRNNLAAAYLYFYAYSYYSTSCRVEANYTVRNNTFTDNQNTGLFAWFFASADTALGGDTQLNSTVLVQGNDFSRNKGIGFELLRQAVSSRTPGNDAAVLGSVTMRDNAAQGNLNEGLYLADYASNSQGNAGASARIVGPYVAVNNSLSNNLGYLGGLVIDSYVNAYETESARRDASVTVTNNTIRGNSGYGAYVSLAGYQYYFKSATERGSFNDTSDFYIAGNRVDTNSRSGLYVNFDLNSEATTTVANPRVENNSFSGNLGGNALYLNLQDLQGYAVVENNQISSNQVQGVVGVATGGKGSGLLFENNTMGGNRAQAYGLSADFAGASYNLTIDNNNASGNDVAAGALFELANNGRTQIFRNVVVGGVNETAVFNLSAPSSAAWITVHNNTLTGNAGKAIAVLTEGLIAVEYNTATNSSRDGIVVLTGGDYLSSLARISINNNTADGNGGNGVWAFATNRLFVADNRARGNGLAGIRINYLASAPQVERNNLTGNRFGLLLSGNGTSPLTASYPLRNLTILNSISAGLYVDDVAVSLYNSSITSTQGVDLSVRQGRIDAFGTTVGYAKGEVRGSGEIHVWWNLSFRVIWQSGIPVPSALIQMNGSMGTPYGQKVANASGQVAAFLAEEWAMVDATRLLWSPYTFTASKAGEEGTNTTPLDRDKEVWITIFDRHAPIITLDAPADGAIFNRSFFFVRGNVTDAGSGIKRVEVWTDGILWFSNETQQDPYGTSFTLVPTVGALPDGNYTLQVRALDAAGLESNLFENVTVDTTAPRLIFLEPSFNLTNVSLVTVTVQTDSDVVQSSIGYDTLLLRSDSTFTSIVHLLEGPNLFRVRATDRAGNVNETMLALTLDTVAPVLRLESPQDGFLTNASLLPVRGTTEAGALLTLNGRNVTLGPGGSFVTAVELADGNNTLDLAARDAAGNWAYLRVAGVLDRVPPFLRVRSPEDGFITALEFVAVEGEVEDGATLYLNGVGVYAIESFSQSVHLNEGDNTILVVARDKAGNEARVTRLVTKDTTVPFLDILDPAGGHGFTSKPFYFIRGMTEAFANVSGGGAHARADETGAFVLLVNLTAEEMILRIEAVDRIGNRNQTAVTITLDTTPPSLTIFSPADKTRYQVSSAEIQGSTDFGALLTIDGEAVQVAVDGVFRWVVTLKPGANNVVVKAVDRAGNAAEVDLTLYLGGGGGAGGDATPPPSAGTGGAVTESSSGSGGFLWVLIIGAAAVGAFYLRSRLQGGRRED